MRLVDIKVIIAIITTLTAVISLILVNLVPTKYSSLILGLEIIILPTIYIVGNLYSEEKITNEKDKSFSIISQKTNELNDKYLDQVLENQMLRFENQMLKQQNG